MLIGIDHRGMQPLNFSQPITILTLGLLVVKTSNLANSHTTEYLYVPNIVEFRSSGTNGN